MNKKGFTLVEMLVVIAIIAVLVAIIVPTAVSATKKAAAATNAANLRNYAAEVAIQLVGGASAADVKDNTKSSYVTPPKAKACDGVNGGEDATFIVNDNGEVVPYFGDYCGVDYFAGIADTGTAGAKVTVNS